MLDQFVEVKALRIICDSVLKDQVLNELSARGATGYTWWQVQGKGSVSEPCWSGNKALQNRIYVEVWCKSSVAEKIVELCRESRFKAIGMIVGIQQLWVHQDEAANFIEQ